MIENGFLLMSCFSKSDCSGYGENWLDCFFVGLSISLTITLCGSCRTSSPSFTGEACKGASSPTGRSMFSVFFSFLWLVRRYIYLVCCYSYLPYSAFSRDSDCLM